MTTTSTEYHLLTLLAPRQISQRSVHVAMLNPARGVAVWPKDPPVLEPVPGVPGRPVDVVVLDPVSGVTGSAIDASVLNPAGTISHVDVDSVHAARHGGRGEGGQIPVCSSENRRSPWHPWTLMSCPNSVTQDVTEGTPRDAIGRTLVHQTEAVNEKLTVWRHW